MPNSKEIIRIQLTRVLYKGEPAVAIQFAYNAQTNLVLKKLNNRRWSQSLKAGIKKPVSLHWLRYSYAMNLFKSGTDLRFIQQLLGHNNSKTTEKCTHVSTNSIQKIRSTFDDL